MVKKMTIQSKTVAEIYEQFQRENHIKNLSPGTIRYYEGWLKPFLSDFGKRAVSSITEKDVEKFLLSLSAKGTMADTTINTCLRAVRAFLYYAMRKGYLASFQISLVKETQPVKEPYTEEELKKLLQKPDVASCSFAQYRNWVIVNFLLATGCRASSLIHVHIEDLNLEAGTVFFQHMKARSQQMMPLPSSLCAILNEYLQYRQGQPEEMLFVSETGNAFSVSSLECAIRHYNQSRGVKKTSLHLFRHTFAKLYIMAGGDAFRLQRLLGHTDLAMTKKYIALYADDLRSNYDKLNPLEQMVSKPKRMTMHK